MLKPDYAGCVYAATNEISGRRYIGKTRMPLRKRIRCHKSAALHGSESSFHGAIRKYGIAAFRWDVLFVSSSDDALFAAEVELIAAARSARERLYNRTDGGEGAPGGFWSAEARKKLSSAMRGKVFSTETRQRLSRALKGKPKSAAHRQASSLAKTGTKLAPWTPERRAKMEAYWAKRRAAGWPMTDEARRNMSEAAKRRCARR